MISNLDYIYYKLFMTIYDFKKRCEFQNYNLKDPVLNTKWNTNELNSYS